MDHREQILLSTITGVAGAALSQCLAKDGRSNLVVFSSVALVSAAIPAVSSIIYSAFSHVKTRPDSFVDGLEKVRAVQSQPGFNRSKS